MIDSTICPVVIVGAPRSGTNMLRDALTSPDGVATWPCDEINYIWRHGNILYPNDAIPAERATPAIRQYIQSKFEQILVRENASVVVEKTCANSLRIPFVSRVLPTAKYIFIVRDGVDATGSARECWSAPFDLRYTLQKLRFVPFSDLPYYATRFLWSHIYRLFSAQKRLAFWGPSIPDLPALLERYSLSEVCALQWQSCVDAADDALGVMPDERVFRLRYEDFVESPDDHLRSLFRFVGVHVDDEVILQVARRISAGSVGKGRGALKPNVVHRLEELIGNTLRRFGYFE